MVELDKLRLLWLGIREAAALFISKVEDYLDIPYDKSLLASRREKVRGGS